MLIIMSTLKTLLSSKYHLLWGAPAIIVSLLDIYFLIRSLLRQPKSIDLRLSTIVISLGSTFGFTLFAILIAGPQPEFSYRQIVQQLGSILSLVPYPFVVWALFCLGDCLTIVPEAHTVVARGIYRYSRHPLYLGYIIWAIADIMMFPGWPMLIAALTQIICLILRLRREEQLLLDAFPEYQAYYDNTGLLGNINIKGAFISLLANRG
jgi:protein-S-isoprenylcysteine O-methyltransferase Ste14